MAKGFKDSKGNFRPTGNKGVSSREKTTHPTGMQIAKVKPNDPNVAVEEEFGKSFVTIFDDDGQEVVTWVEDEWIEDPSIIPAIKNAVRLAKQGKVEEIKRMINFEEFHPEFDPEVERVFQIFVDSQNAIKIKDDALSIRQSEKFEEEIQKLNSKQQFAIRAKVVEFLDEDDE